MMTSLSLLVFDVHTRTLHVWEWSCLELPTSQEIKGTETRGLAMTTLHGAPLMTGKIQLNVLHNNRINMHSV